MPFELKRISEIKDVNLSYNIIDFNAIYFNGDFFVLPKTEKIDNANKRHLLGWCKVNSNEQQIYVPSSDINKKFDLKTIDNKIVKKTEIINGNGDLYMFFLIEIEGNTMIEKKLDAMSVSKIEDKKNTVLELESKLDSEKKQEQLDLELDLAENVDKKKKKK